MSVFETDTEAEAYQVLHEGDLDALESRYGTAIAFDLVNAWGNRGLVRVKWVDGRYQIRTFKKYAA